jgi:RHS repeat-associated protein
MRLHTHRVVSKAIVAVFFLFSSFPVFAGTFIAFGPQSYQRGTGDPVTVTNSFTVLNPSTTYTLRINNGGLVDGEFELVSSSVFVSNGVEIVGPNEFNQNVTVIEKPITLSSSNELSVEVRGKPGGGLTLQIIGTDNDLPTLILNSPAEGLVTNNSILTVSGTASDATTSVTQIDVNGTPANLVNGAFNLAVVLTEGSNLLTVTAVDLAGNATSVTRTVILETSPPEALPPDPVTVAPPINRTVATSLPGATAFLYSGSNPIQTGVAPGAINPNRVSVLRGAVKNRNGQALPGVKIGILNHPEFGNTLSRADGLFDMAVNGGGLLTVTYEKAGYLSVQRQITPPWQDYSWLPEVIMISYDNQVSAIDLSVQQMQVARGSLTVDEDGSRQATLLFPPFTTANMRLPDGTTEALALLHVRATEYTVGRSGSQAMPAELPSQSGYTYAVELSVDEAVSAGAVEVEFSGPIITYVENFIGLPVGSAMPAGYYDRGHGAWTASQNGRVIRILSVSGGFASVDVDGSNTPATSSALSKLGITSAELQQLANLYLPGQNLWRVAITHFTPWDFNLPYGPPDDAVAPSSPEPERNKPIDDPSCRAGSIIECQNQILQESVLIVGTPFKLHYASDRVLGRRENYSLKIPASQERVPTSLKRIELKIEVAGRQFTATLEPAPDQDYTFIWDGRDAYNRVLQGRQLITVRTRYVYPAQYFALETDFMMSFARFPGEGGNGQFTLLGGERFEVVIEQQWHGSIGTWDASALGFGGWSLDLQHVYDPIDRMLYQGDGRRRSTEAQGQIITTVAGTGVGGFSGDNGPATQAQLAGPVDVTVGPDGSLYIADPGNYRVRKVSPDGIITTVAGSGIPGLGEGGEGGPATEAEIRSPKQVAIGPDGSPYIADSYPGRIKRVGPDGILTTIAGGGSLQPYQVNGRSATLAYLSGLQGVAVGPDGSVYTSRNFQIFRVDQDGIFSTIVQDNSGGSIGDGGLAIDAALRYSENLSVGPDGSIYIAETNFGRVRKIGPDGKINTVAGGGACCNLGDGGLATQARLNTPRDVVVGPDGSLYIADNAGVRIRRVSPDGIISTVAGNGTAGFSGDGGPAYAALVRYPYGVAFGPDGSLYIADTGNHRIRRVAPALPGLSFGDLMIPSEDGQEIYHFDAGGRLLRILDALTQAAKYQLNYDANGLLVQIVDVAGNITSIERDAGGNATAIVAPGGQRTVLTLNPSGYLETVTNPAGEATQLGYANDGLLSTLRDPAGNLHRFYYDELGRLDRDEDPAGGFSVLSRTGLADGFTVDFTTAMNRLSRYSVENLAGVSKRTNRDPSGLQTIEEIKTDDSRVMTLPNGMILTQVPGPDPRWGMKAPIISRFQISTPESLSSTITSTRSVTLSDPANPLTLLSQTDSVNINGRTYTTAYNATQRLITDTSPVGRTTLTRIDALGRVLQKQITGLDPINFAYDTQGRLSSITQGSGQTARIYTFGYDAQNQLTSVTDPVSGSNGFSYDLAGRVTTQILPGSRTVMSAYDANGNQVSLTPPRRPAHTFGYTPINLEASYTPPAFGAETTQTQYTYNLDRQLTQITRPDGMIVIFGYDSGGRLSTVTSPRGQASYSYDPTTGSLTSVTAPDGGTLTYSYNGSLLTGSIWAGTIAGAIGYTYNNDFRITSESVNGAQSITFGYDLDGLLTQAGSLTMSRSAQHGLITGTTIGIVTDMKTYSGFGEISTYQASVSGAPVFRTQFTQDRMGRIVQKVETVNGVSNTYTYEYDAAGRLTDVINNTTLVAHYDYDANSNRIGYTTSTGTVIGQYNVQDRLIQYGDTTYSYTANGELSGKTNTASGETTSYIYDALGNLMSATLPDGTRIDYLIDGQNRRVGRKINGVLVQGFLYKNQLNPVAELDGNNNIVSRFVYGTKTNVPDYMVKGGVTYRIISDHLGSPRLVIDTSTGSVAHQMDYDEFGRVIQDTNPGFQPFGFAGGIYDRDTKLTRFGVRDYDSEIGRWTAKDPIQFKGGDLNLYGYVLGDPVNLIDPLGLVYQATLGVNLFGGFSVFAFPGIFAGGGVNFGFTSSGQLFIQFQATLQTGLGAFGGVGFQGGGAYSDCPIPSGISTQNSLEAAFNVGWVGSAGGSVNYAGGGDIGVNRSLRGGVGYGIAATTGITTTTTIASPPLFGN